MPRHQSSTIPNKRVRADGRPTSYKPAKGGYFAH